MNGHEAMGGGCGVRCGALVRYGHFKLRKSAEIAKRCSDRISRVLAVHLRCAVAAAAADVRGCVIIAGEIATVRAVQPQAAAARA